jgi:uncharacterized membrane protein YkvA (DUF1232 family)
MFERIRIILKLPGYALLSWRLLKDPRVPSASKAMALIALLLIYSPLDILDWIPFVGGVGELALVALVLRTFINAAPEDVRSEHMSVLGMSSV